LRLAQRASFLNRQERQDRQEAASSRSASASLDLLGDLGVLGGLKRLSLRYRGASKVSPFVGFVDDFF
jgi:hypothetical protein